MADLPERIQLSRAAGWRMPADAIKVDRSTRWGNPFKVGAFRRDGPPGSDCQIVRDAATAVTFFREMLTLAERNYPSDAEIREALRGRCLACWCKLGEPCHADVLIELANATEGAA